MVSNVRRGDQVVTGGGMFGKVTKVIDETTVQVELAENVRVKVISSTLTDVLSSHLRAWIEEEPHIRDLRVSETSETSETRS